MKTFIPHVYFSAPEDTVGDLVNQIRRESEIPGTAEPKPEMKDSGKKSIIPKTVVSAPEKDTVGDLIEQLHKEPEAIPEEKPEEKTEQPEKTEGKKSIIPKTVVSAAKSELDRVYDLLTSGEDLQMNPDGTLKAIRIEGTEYKGKALLDKVDQLVRTAYFDADDSPEKDFAMDYIWYLWEGKDSPLFDKSRMATFERCFIDDKSVQKEEKGAYYSLREEESVCDMLLDEFGVIGTHRHIINGHVPVKTIQGENPIKANGKMMVIDGGFSKAYHSETGIAGYTLVYHSRGFQLVQHEPFTSMQKAIEEGQDIKSSTQIVEMSTQRMMVKDTDKGRELVTQINDLKKLLMAYRTGLIKEKSI